MTRRPTRSEDARREAAPQRAPAPGPAPLLHHADCRTWLRARASRSVHAIVTDPPFTVADFEDGAIDGMAANVGPWRRPPTLGGVKRAPVPRFTAMTAAELDRARSFFGEWAAELPRVLVPGAHVIVATTPLLLHIAGDALAGAGLERRGAIVRLVQTLRGGDAPKGAEAEFPAVCSLPLGGWEPWLVFRNPLPKGATVAACLRAWKAGALRGLGPGKPFCDVIPSERTPKRERRIANHPCLKPQSFTRAVVRAALPLGEGVVVDPFMGGGGIVAAAVANGYAAEGVERRADYHAMAEAAVPRLAALAL